MQLDKLIKGGTIVTPEGRFTGAIGIKDGKIACVTECGDGMDAEEVIDAAGKFVLPGAIDGHLHYQEPVKPYQEDVEHATQAAAVGGITTGICMTVGQTNNVDEYRNMQQVFEGKGYIDYAFHGFARPANMDSIEDLWTKTEVCALKMYTTYANLVDDGSMYEIFEIAENFDFILSIHGETNGFSLDREFEFGEIFKQLAINFPKLKIIMEHLSDRRSIDLLHKYNNLFATITLHHITMSLDDGLGKGLNPHHFCKPILKTPKDRNALLELALSGDEKVSFGSDSAPHLQSNKLKQNGAAGIFSAPILLPKLCEIFEKYNKLDNLQKFISDNAMKIYDLKNIPNKKITLIKETSRIQDSIKIDNDCIIPFLANEELSWKIKEN